MNTSCYFEYKYALTYYYPGGYDPCGRTDWDGKTEHFKTKVEAMARFEELKKLRFVGRQQIHKLELVQTTKKYNTVNW